MHTGPSTTTSPGTGPRRPGGGRGMPLLIGGLAFAVVFLLIVGATVGYLVLRPGSGGGDPTASATAATESASASTEQTTEATSAAEEERCWSPDQARSSKNPSGKLRGGGLEMIPPEGFDDRDDRTEASFVTDAARAAAKVEGTWYSTVAVGEVVWQPGVEYPGDRDAAERIFACLVSNSAIWGGTSGRSVQDQVTEPVTVAGMSGYRTTGVLRFGQDTLEKTDGTRIMVAVISTPEGPSAFVSDVAVGVTEHEEAQSTAYDSLTGLSG